MISPGARWSLPRGNTLVPSRWQATSRDPMQHESLPRPVIIAPQRSSPVYRLGRHSSSKPRLVSVLVSFTPVRHRSLASAGRPPALVRTLTDAGERWCAVLESV